MLRTWRNLVCEGDMTVKEQSLFDMFKVVEIELNYRSAPDMYNRPIVKSSAISHEVFRNHWDANKIDLQEQFKILLLNKCNACLGIVEIATGGVSYCYVDTKLIFATALKANASSIILAHNHPSGNLQPSSSDIDLTKRLTLAGELLGVRVFDHLILTSSDYMSFADKGLMP